MIGAIIYGKAKIVITDSECKRLLDLFGRKPHANGKAKHILVSPKGSKKQTSLIIQ